MAAVYISAAMGEDNEDDVCYNGSRDNCYNDGVSNFQTLTL